MRPEKITLTLTDNYNNVVATKDVTAEDNWEYVFDKLPGYDKEGNEITYTLTESDVSGYTATITDYNVTNTHELETISYSIIKKWADSDNQDVIRPDEITVRVKDKTTGEEAASASLNEANGWKCEFKELNMYKDGKLIEYEIVEDPVQGYTYDISETSENVFEIINTHIPETTEITISNSISK